MALDDKTLFRVLRNGGLTRQVTQSLVDRFNAGNATSSSGSGLPSTVVTKTTNYTANAGEWVEADCTSAGFTVTLPTAPTVGALVAVKKISNDANTLTIAPAGGGTIDGDPNATTTTKMAGAVFEHVGSNVWRIAASMTTTGPQGPQGPTGATGPQGPAGTNGTNGTNGVGVPAGGTSGQVLKKNSGTDYDTVWGTVSGGAGSPTTPTLVGVRLKAGEWTAPPVTNGITTGFAASGEVYAVRLPIAKGGNINGLALDLTTGGGTGSVVKLALFADDGTGYYPGLCLAVSGALDGTTVATKTFTPGSAQAVADGTVVWLVSGAFGAPSPNPVVRTWSIGAVANTPAEMYLGYTFATSSQFFTGGPNWPLGWRLTGQADLPAAGVAFPAGATKVATGSGLNMPAAIALGS